MKIKKYPLLADLMILILSFIYYAGHNQFCYPVFLITMHA
jgi:hypothetical protein